LSDTLAELGEPVCMPSPFPAGSHRYSASGLYDVCLALNLNGSVVGNDVTADGKTLVIITGANQGGKSTFLRSVGLAQLMMQCGMFAPAEVLSADVCERIFTHYKREEDATMISGKFDEELRRLSSIVDFLVPNAMLLFNESFAATNEREGSEIARQVVDALIDERVEVFFVTHQYTFARGLQERNRPSALFLRAERLSDGSRTFEIAEGAPLETSYGPDLYRETFAEPTAM
jgi:DNA mismatch repair ATPase MutS